MGFYLEINSIIRTDEAYALQKGGIFPFEKSGSRVFFDDIPIWLTRDDWTALAEIKVVTQTREPDKVTGSFQVLHVYDAVEQAAVTEVFRRMYASGRDPFIYLLIGGEDYQVAVDKGTLYEDSFDSQGFIHGSPLDQLTRVANKFYADVADVKVMVVRTVKIQAAVKWEPATGGLYPHIYGPMNMDAVERVVPVAKGADGRFEIGASDLG